MPPEPRRRAGCARRGLALVAAALLAAACAAQRDAAPQGGPAGAVGSESGKPVEAGFLRAASASQPGMTCRQATAAARGALLRLGYEVVATRPASAEKPGELRAVKHTGWMTGTPGSDYHAVVEMRCDNRGTEFTALTDEPLLSRLAFRREFPQLIAEVAARHVDRPRASNQAPQDTGLAITVEPLRDGGRGVFAGDLSAVGITPVHVLIRNQTEQTYSFEVARLQLVTQERQRRQALGLAEVEARVPPASRAALTGKTLGDTAIAPGATVEGYLFFPASTYRRADVVLIDRDSEEAEGFGIEF